jgi:hypothetical protein
MIMNGVAFYTRMINFSGTRDLGPRRPAARQKILYASDDNPSRLPENHLVYFRVGQTLLRYVCGSLSITSSAVTCIYASHMHLLGLFRDNGVVSILALTLTEIKVGRF